MDVVCASYVVSLCHIPLANYVTGSVSACVGPVVLLGPTFSPHTCVGVPGGWWLGALCVNAGTICIMTGAILVPYV